MSLNLSDQVVGTPQALSVGDLSTGPGAPQQTYVRDPTGAALWSDTLWQIEPSWINARRYTDLAQAIALVGTGTKKLWIANGAFVCPSDQTVPSNLILQIEGDGQISMGAGVDLTINSPLSAPRKTIFIGAGASGVRFGELTSDLWGEWWGLLYGNSAANESANNTALAALAAACTAGKVARFGDGVIRYTTGFDIGGTSDVQREVTYLGTARAPYDAGTIADEAGALSALKGTVLYYKGSGTAIRIGSRGVLYRGIHLIGSASAVNGIQLGISSDIAELELCQFTVTQFTGTNAHGIVVGSGRFITGSKFERIGFNKNYHGLEYSSSSSTCETHKCTFNGNTSTCFRPYGTDHRDVHSLYQGNATRVVDMEASNVTIGRVHLSKPYFESNTATYSIYIRATGSGVTARLRGIEIDSPLLQAAGDIFLENTTGIVCRNPRYPTSKYTEVDASPFTETGVNVGVRIEPRALVESGVGALVSAIHALAPGTVRALFIFQNRTGTTLSDFSGNALTATYTKDAGDGTDTMQAWVNSAPLSIKLDAAAYWEVNDATALTFGDGSADTAMTIACLCKPAAFAGATIAAKYDNATGATKREYIFQWGTDAKLVFESWDDSVSPDTFIGRKYNTAYTTTHVWRTPMMTKGTGITSAAVKLYDLGTRIDDTNREANAANYVAMENKTAKLAPYWLPSTPTKQDQFTGQMSVLALFAEEFTQAKITALDALLRGWAGVLY